MSLACRNAAVILAELEVIFAMYFPMGLVEPGAKHRSRVKTSRPHFPLEFMLYNMDHHNADCKFIFSAR